MNTNYNNEMATRAKPFKEPANNGIQDIIKSLTPAEKQLPVYIPEHAHYGKLPEKTYQISPLENPRRVDKPYIGITGFKDLEEIQMVKDANGIYVPASEYEKNRQPPVMYGALTSSKRMDEPTKSGSRSPAYEKLPELLANVPAESIPMVHYAPRSKERLGPDLEKIMRDTKGTRAGIQINDAWPNRDTLYKLQQQYGPVPMVLQLPKEVLQTENPAEMLGKISGYNGIVSYVLLDPSGGRGENIDTGRYGPLLKGLAHQYRQQQGPTIIIAGGLGPDGIEGKLGAFATAVDYSPFGIDAETNLRSTKGSNSYLDRGACTEYLINARKGYRAIIEYQAKITIETDAP